MLKKFNYYSEGILQNLAQNLNVLLDDQVGG